MARASTLPTPTTGQMSRPYLPLVAGGLAFVVYAATLSRSYAGDSILFAQVVESGDLRELFSPQRILIQPIGWLMYQLWKLVGWDGNALLPLQVLNALGGALSVGLICRIGQVVLGSSRLALLTAGGFAVSSGPWYFSTDQECITVPLAMMLAILLPVLTASSRTAARPIYAVALGIGTGAVTLTFMTGLFLAPAAVASWLLTPELAWRTRLRQSLIYLVGVAATFLPAYLLTIWALFDVRSIEALASWRLYGGLGGTPHDLYGRLSLTSLPHGLYGFLRSLAWFPGIEVNASTAYYLAQAGVGERAAFVAFHGLLLLVVATPVALIAARWRSLSTDRRRVLMTLAVWATCYAAFATYWVPGDPQFWLPVLACWWLVVGLALVTIDEVGVVPGARWASLVPSRARLTRATAVLVALLLVVNGAGLIAPNMSLDGNRPYLIASSVRDRTAPQDLILTGGGDTLFLYVPYFAGRRTLSVYHELLARRDKSVGAVEASINREIVATRAAGGRIYVVGARAERTTWAHAAETVAQTTSYLERLPTRPAWTVADEEVLEVVN
jgi:hypothetical protein